MSILHNRIAQAELKAKLYEEAEPRVTVSFYKYFPIGDPLGFRDSLYQALYNINVFGRIYVAGEGINAQVSIPASKFAEFKEALYKTEGLADVRLNIAVDNDGKSFWVLKIKVREKIVADGINDPYFNMDKKGKYVDAETFNRLTEDPDTVVVDMRNHYEYEVGHFNTAIEIPSDTFREQLPMAATMLDDKKEKNIIMYCTGGIRCEKASAYMLHRGFKNVFHLEGGIINYANAVRKKDLENKFRGKNFVFDDRLGERITDEVIALCHQCGKPADTHTNCKNECCHLLFIQCSECAISFKGSCSEKCKSILQLSDEDQKELRKNTVKGSTIFNKSRQRLRPDINQ